MCAEVPINAVAVAVDLSAFSASSAFAVGPAHGIRPAALRDDAPQGHGPDDRRYSTHRLHPVIDARRSRAPDMKRFAALYAAIDASNRTNDKVDAMVRYFESADHADAAWAVYFLSGGRPKRLIPARRLAMWAGDEADVPEWLFEECYHAVGDLAETIALLLPDTGATSDRPLHEWIATQLIPLA